MNSRVYQVLKATFFILLWTDISAKSKAFESCPIGFELLERKDAGPLCYRPKGREKFGDKYKDCVGNLYSTKLLREVKNLHLLGDNAVWTEYKSMHPGGTYVDWSYSKNMGEKLESEYDVTMDDTLDLEDELCLVKHPYSNYTVAKCNELYYSLCVVKPYSSDLSSTNCGHLKDAVRFYSPDSTCLSHLSGVGGGTVRATWSQAQDLCLKKGGSLLNRGWHYVNHKKFRKSGVNHVPFGVILSSDYNTLRYDTTDDNSEIPLEQWQFNDTVRGEDTFLGSIQNNRWDLVNNSFIFYDVICERRVPLRNITMQLTIDDENKLTLTVNESLDEEDIYCFTDSVSRHPVKISISQKDDKKFILKPKQNGYYWCTHIKTRKYKLIETKKVLFIREKTSVVNTYAVKIRLIHARDIPYKLDDLPNLLNITEYKLREYIYFRNKYESIFKDASPEITTDMVNQFISSYSSIILKSKLKRLYMDRRSILFHVTLGAYLIPVSPGTWKEMEIISMKPVYYCKSFDLVPQMILGKSISLLTPAGCRAHTCVGDFNEGVQWVTTVSNNCSQPTNKGRADFDYDGMPTISTSQIPEDRLQEVIQNLEQLINNGSTVMVEDVDPMFDQVDDILEIPDSVGIPGRFLHLLEKLGSTIELNGSRSAFVVRSNIALGITDSGPENPVRGLKIGSRDNDNFNNGSFEMLLGELNNTDLSADRNEMVVYLPQSVSEYSQRLSFVVFRNDRAFQSSEGVIAVNSRVLSVKVGNVTNFDNGEVIDIHLSPLSSNPERNISRTCAYWEFREDGSGFWSSEGCRLIISGPGKLDICRCTHLTHFAEVLFPRQVFSQANEDALRMLSIIGCSVSIFGVVFVGITSALFRSWRREFSNKIWFQLCISIFILALTFLVIIFAKYDHYSVICMLFGILLHYSVLSSFCWMLVAAILSYRRLVLVFTRDASHKLLRASAFAWGAPFAVIGVLLSIAPHSYSERFEDKTPNGSFCYPSGLGRWLSVNLPIALILLVNWTLFGLIVRSVFASSRIPRHGDTNEAFRCASVSCLLVFLFGLPWVFGLFAFNIVAAYLFTLTATFQGFVLFIFFVVGNKKTRDMWLNKLKIKQTRKVPVTSSTYSNRSTVWRGATQNVTFEAKASKPKSLSQDNSRFS